jgi:S-DNA-T family DNA segregation ATPase FtsK/SpoIIIE
VAEKRIRVGLLRRRWRLELRLYLVAVVACGVLVILLGRYWGETAFAALALAGVVTSEKLRYELGLRLTQRFRLRRSQKLMDVSLGADSPEMLSRGPSFVGEVITCRVNLGSSARAIEHEAPVLAAALGARDVRVRQQRENAALLELLVVRNETLQQPVDPTLLLSRYRPNLYDCVPLGIDEDGEDVVIGLVGRHLLIGGETGAGKSGSLSVVLASGALDPDCDIWCFDGKLVELAAWRPVAERVVGSEMTEANEALDELLSEMNRRYERLLARKGRKVEQGDGERTLLVVIDELAFYVANGDKKAAQQFSEKLRDLVARARAAGIVVVAATQKPSADLIPSALRDNFGYRLAHRCATRDASDTILGSGWAAEQISASTIDPRLRGVGYLLADGGVPHRIRSMYLDDEAISSIVTAAVARRERT